VTAPRRAYSLRTAAADYSVSLKELLRAIEEKRVRTRKAGSTVLLHPDDLEREFGFEPAAPPRRIPSERARAMAKELLP
jgi:hypothetical protein